MPEQMNLFETYRDDDLDWSIFPEMEPDLTEKFWTFHKTNPHVYQSLKSMALALRSEGVKRFGINDLVGAFRWKWITTTKDPSGFKMNNNFNPFWSRLLMAREPELADLFETRHAKADDEL